MGVLNNSKSSVVDCYNVATISGGHSTYANGGTGGIAGQFGDGSIANSYNYGNVTLGEGLVCNNLGGVIVSGCTEIPAAGHTPELRDAKDAGCTQDGYTGDTCCSVCGQLLTRGQVIPAKDHDYQDGKCTVCGAEDPDYQPEQPTQPEIPASRPAMRAMWFCGAQLCCWAAQRWCCCPGKSGADTGRNKRR